MWVIAITDPTTDPTGPNATVLVVVSALALIIIVSLLLGVLVTARKRVRGTTWFPEGFSFTNKNQRSHERPGAEGQEMR